MLQVGPEAVRAPSLLRVSRETLRSAGKRDVVQLFMLCGAAISWLLIPELVLTRFNASFVGLLLCCTISAYIVAGLLEAMSSNFDHYRWGRRTNVLLTRIGRPRPVPEDMLQLLLGIQCEIRELRFAVDTASAGGFMTQLRRRILRHII